MPRCFKKVLLDGNASFDPREERAWVGGDTFTYTWSLTRSPPSSILSRRTLGDPHASFVQTEVTALLRPDREGVYTCTLEVYDGCAPPVTKSFDITVAWEQECVTRAEAQRLGIATPLVFILALIALAGLLLSPPLSWTHPRQVMLDAMAAVAARRNAEYKALVHAEAVVDAPRMHAAHAKESREGRDRRMARRAAAKDTALRGLPPTPGRGGGDHATPTRSPGRSPGHHGGGDMTPTTPTSAGRRRGQAMSTRKATALEKTKAWLTLISDYAFDAVDTLTWRPLRFFLHVRSALMRLWMWLFQVPGGWMGLLLRAHLIMELPALVATLIRPGVPPFARDGGGAGSIVAFVTPALLLGANMTTEDVYMALTVFTGFAVLALTGPGLGVAFAWLSRRTWDGVWRIADTVEAGGAVVTAKQLSDPEAQARAEAKIELLRKTRQRKSGVCIPRKVWRMGTDVQTMESLSTYCEIPAVKKMLEANEEEAEEMMKWTRKGLTKRRTARWLSRLSRALKSGGVIGIAIMSTVGFLPAMHAGLSTLIPCATDHSKPYVYMAKDPAMFFASPPHIQLVGRGCLVVITAFSAAVYRSFITAEQVVSLRPQPAFEIAAAAIKCLVAAVSVTWEAQLGREAVSAAREGVVQMAWFHDVAMTASAGALLVLHVGMQSLRGDAASWNQWRAAAYFGTMWTGALSCAAKLNGHGPNRLAFLNQPEGPGAGAPDAHPAGVEFGDETFWRTLLSATIVPAMISAAVVNRLLFQHVCLAEEVARPTPPGSAVVGGRDSGNPAGGGSESAAAAAATPPRRMKRRGDQGKGSRYEPSSGSPGASYRGYSDDEDDEEDIESGGLGGGGGGRGWRASLTMKPKTLFGGFAKRIADGASHAAAAVGSPVKSAVVGKLGKSAVALARSPYRRDRIVAWLCEYLNLNAFDKALTGKVTEARSDNPELARASVDELLALVAVLLSGPDGWIRSGSEGLAQHALAALAQGAGAAAVHDPTLAWRALPMILEALQSPIPALRAAAAEAICEPDFATAAAALLFRRHDVGMRRPRLFELRRMLDVTWEDPVLISQQELPDTGLTKHTQLDASWRGDLLVPWRVIQRGRARALVEMDLGGDDGSLGGEGDVALHRALCALDPTGEVLGGTPLAAGGGVKTGGVVLFITS